ncbi:P-loop containing nucleoside triphosphate hydrolase protein [Athelia psychrophila]|uniref:P-loop containing nucleoside triphosphate hydrolase protein n=1 Tax=Athelia psychrophila TaxID=1759441 RepID=A0A166PDA7_9AGAM|nr:P-loop containing nucleoside triphosphate hydrolase protein [Fibularhizoctonia sp. CBS 109695]
MHPGCQDSHLQWVPKPAQKATRSMSHDFQNAGLQILADVQRSLWFLGEEKIAFRSIHQARRDVHVATKRKAIVDELVATVEFIKFFAGEEQSRGGESRSSGFKACMNSAMFSLLWILSPILVACVKFFTNGPIVSIIVFTAPLNIIPAWIVQILQTKVAVDRIAVYLDEDEVSDQASTLKKLNKGPRPRRRRCAGHRKWVFKWNAVDQAKGKSALTPPSPSPGRRARPPCLRDSVDQPSPGPRPAAKLHFWYALSDIRAMALPDEPTLQPASGRIIMSKNLSKVNAHELMHAISYSAQSPWLRPQSIKDNILFGFPYDGERYNAVVECCALQTDLSIFEDGDDTEIGARGLSLSGGQKTRVALARAVYTRTKYVLLDDPLSAVDSHTSRFQFEKLLRALWLANRM